MATTIIHSAKLYPGPVGSVIDNGAVAFTDNTITRVGRGDDWQSWDNEGADIIDAHGAPVCPGYIDIHHHGAAGEAYDDGPEAAKKALAAHRSHGTTRAVLSFVTASRTDLMERVRAMVPLVKEDARVLGIHPEGPFLHPSHKGAHPPQLLIDPLEDIVTELLQVADGTLAQITIAPERENGMEAVRMFAQNGVAPAVGHTSATYDQTLAAADAGAKLLTHTFNGMDGIHHRAPGPVIAGLDDTRLWLEVINDGVHVHPAAVRMLFERAKERMVLVTDAMAATCCADGDYMLGELAVNVKDGVARLVEGGALAGSTLTMDVAVANCVNKCKLPLDWAVAAATTHAASAIGRGDEFGRLADGYPADVLILDPQTLLPTAIYCDGQQVELPA